MSKHYIGVDLGLKGGIVVLKDGKIVYKCVMPLSGGKLDIRSVGSLFNKYSKMDSHLIFEKFSGFFGYAKKAATSLANQSGQFEAAAKLTKLPFTTITPQQWQKVMWEGTTMVFKKSGGKSVKDTKKISLITINRLFPQEEWLASERCSVPHDGMVDACLLGEFGRRKNL